MLIILGASGRDDRTPSHRSRGHAARGYFVDVAFPHIYCAGVLTTNGNVMTERTNTKNMTLDRKVDGGLYREADLKAISLHRPGNCQSLLCFLAVYIWIKGLGVLHVSFRFREILERR